ncbi:hypothetical protein V5O48_013667 [Marasmius crinis-equi]|uniref:Uncharacterized protein n=1 Tax=Marasmius crinis-equi TaxID=585013 RepID=A0ABR3EZI5_9AGAR
MILIFVASISLGQQGPEARLQAGTGPNKFLSDIMKDPSKMSSFMEMMKADIEDAKRRGETMQERAVREKREWAEADAKASKFKEEANEAFRKGDYKEAFVIYSVCVDIGPHEPVYRLNRAAAALNFSLTNEPSMHLIELKLFDFAIEDASSCLDDDYNPAKAYFRRSQAHSSLGQLKEAREDLDKARRIQPADATLSRESQVLSGLEAQSFDELSAWIADQNKQSMDDLFGEGGLEELVEQRVNEAGVNLRHQVVY